MVFEEKKVVLVLLGFIIIFIFLGKKVCGDDFVVMKF